MVEVLEFTTEDGHSPFEAWFEDLPVAVALRVRVVLGRFVRGNLGDHKRVGKGGLFEYRLDLGPGYRIYFGRDGQRLVVLVGGGTKRRQQADIESAQRLWEIYKERRRSRPWH